MLPNQRSRFLDGLSTTIPATVLLAAAALLPGVASAQADVQVVVDPGADAHPISPLIYGINFATAEQIDAGRLALSRWGGNRTSRYNWKIDVDNTGLDYYFENIPGCWISTQGFCSPVPADPQTDSGANRFLDLSAAKGIASFFTVPGLGWVAKPPPAYGHPFPCGCPKSVTATQDSFDPYDLGCGNGMVQGAFVTCASASATSIAIDSSFAGEWAAYLVGRFGPSGGKRIYLIDNEPALWSSTHHDVHPLPTTYDELWTTMRDTAHAVLASDPTAETAGPVEWGWPNYFCSAADDVSRGCSASSPDRKNHGGQELVAWLLDQFRAYEQANGERLLHFLDLHYYPQGGSPPDNTRSLWDPTYVDPSWINDTIRLIPRMREWVAAHYPGTKLAVSEYDFHHHAEPVGAVAYAELLGIFGREGLDAATAWGGPAATETAFAAFKLYGNYDGQGGRFADTSVRATVTGTGVRAYAAKDDARITAALVNETSSAKTIEVDLGGFPTAASGAWYVNSGASIVRQADAPASGGKSAVSLPAVSIGMLVVAKAVVEVDGGTAGSDAGTQDAGPDAGFDAGADAGLDGGPVDAGLDASADAGLDGGPVDAGLDAGVAADVGVASDGDEDGSGGALDAGPSIAEGAVDEVRGVGGCGCASAPSAGLLGALGAVVGAWRRRRRWGRHD